MVIHYNEKKLQDILQDFYNATGVNICLRDADFAPIAGLSNARNIYCKCVQDTPVGKEACLRADLDLIKKCRLSGKPEMHVCPAGLMDIAVPILYNDLIIAYVIMGQMKITPDFSEAKSGVAKLGLDPDALRKIYEEIPFFDTGKLQSIANIAVMLTRYILLENMLIPSLNENIGNAERYINDNLQKELTIQDISEGTNISKSVLYKNFRTSFDCTVKEYINAKRIDRSVELLTSTELSMEEISQKVGFASAAYFSKIFKRYKGVSPLKFRKLQTR